MHFAVTLRVLGILLMLFSIAMVPPLAIALVTAEDHSVIEFTSAFGITFFSGLLMWLPLRNVKQELRIRDGFLITSLFWTVLGIFGSLPLALADGLHLTPIEAIFESISGLTSSGGTVIVGLDDLPPSILFYRQLLQWMGGIGIIVVAVAVLPMLGVGGMQLYKAETPGPSKDNKLTPRIAGTAKALFTAYVFITIACALTYYALGMSAFDAICHSFSTLALGGFSTHDASLGYFKSNAILVASSFFMLVSGMNFGLHFMAWRRKSLSIYRHDSETRFYGAAVAVCVAVTVAVLFYNNVHENQHENVIHGVFQVVSIITTTGYTSGSMDLWPPTLPILAIFFSCMGGCVGSTSGGVKSMRVMLMCKQGVRELKQLVHPSAVIPLKIGRRRVDATIVSAVWSFFAMYSSVYIFLLLALMGTGLAFVTAFSAVAAALNNLGMGIAGVSQGFGDISGTAQAILCFAMLLGRLEIFTLLVLFTPAFWRT